MYSSIIFKPLEYHLNDFSLLHDCNPFLAAALADNLFPTVLLKIVGGMEQKVKEIAWQLGNMDLEFRRNMMLNANGKESFKYKDSFNYSDIELLAKNASNMSSVETSENTNALENILLCKNAYHVLSDKFTNLNFLHTAFKSHWNCFEDDNLIEAIKNNTNTNGDISKSILKPLLESSIRARHAFAHNTYSFQMRFSSLADVYKNRHAENYFMYFFVLIYVDHCLMDCTKKAFANRKK